MRRTAVLVSSLLLLTVAPARAADPAPAPTVSVSVTSNGVALPKAGTKASWTVTNAGQVAQLDISAINPPGAVTVVDAVWTSHPFRVYKGLPLMEYLVKSSHAGAVTSSLPAGFRYGFRTRVPGRAWSSWSDVLVGYEAGPGLRAYDSQKRFLGTALRSGKVQVQFRWHVEVADAGRESDAIWLVGYS